jgi:MFS family permease
MFYVAFLVIGLGSSLAIQMLPMTMVARWFRKNIGKASGILAVGTGIGGVFIPLLVKLIDTYGWQNALIVLAIGLWVVGIPLSLVFRNRPEEHGLLPDGSPPDIANGSDNPEPRDSSISVRQAIKMRAFWFIGITLMLQIATINAVILHLMPYLASIGLERSSASQVSMVVALASMGARIPFGLLSDIFQKRYVMALTCGLLSAGAFLFWLIDGSSFVLILLFAVTFGLGMGGFQPVRTPTIAEYFGTRNFGAILGLLSIFVTIGMIVSPPMAGWVFDTLGYYDPAWLILSVTALAGAILILLLPPPPGSRVK